MSYIGNQLQSTNFVTDVFTGDAATTAFTLSRTPASVTSIIVFIDGVKQASIGGAGAYTLVGTTLNFTAAPPNNAVVEVIHLGVQSLVNVPSSATVTANSLAPELRAVIADQFTANGTGTTFTLSAPPINSNSVVVTANGVVQYDYSVSGATLILNFTPVVNTLIRAAGMGNILTTGTITDDSVSTAKLQLNSVTTAKLANGSVTGPKLGLTSINANNIVDASITGGKLASATITGDKLGLNAISGNNIAPTITLSNITVSNTGTFLGSVVEKANIVSTTGIASSTIIAPNQGGVVYFTANSVANATINFTGLSSVGVGNIASYVVIVTNNTANPKYISTIQVDGANQSTSNTFWAGGAPTTGTANTDIYSFNVIKMSATPTYNIFAQVSNFRP